jgi:hypothetical protein
MKLNIAGLALLLGASTAVAAVDPVLLNLVMPDAKILCGVQVDQSRASALGQYLLSQMQAGDNGFQMFITATGFDPRRDVNEILAASTGAAEGDSRNALVLARGTFQPARISSAATVAGGVVTTYRGYQVIAPASSHSGSSGSSGSPGPSLAFLDATTAIMGSPDLVKAAIDRRAAGSVFSGPLAQKASDVSAASQAWFATLTPPGELLNGNPQTNFLQAVVAASGGVSFGADAVTITADAVTRSQQDAQALADVMRFMLSMIGANNPKAAPLQNAAPVFLANGAVMHASLSLPEQQVEQLFALARQ